MNFAIIAAFSVRERRFPASQGADAREFRNEQLNRWLSLIDNMMDNGRLINGDMALVRDMREISDLLRSYIDKIVFIHEASEGFWIVSSSIPLLDRLENHSDLLHCDQSELISALSYEIIKGLSAIPDLSDRLKSLKSLGSSYYMLKQMDYVAEAVAYKSDNASKINDISAKSQSLLKSLEEHLEIYRNGTKINSEKHQNDIEIFAFERRAALQKMQDSANEKLESVLAARQELDRIRQPVKLWSSAAKRHKINFAVGLVLLSSAIVGAFYFAIEHINPVLINLNFVKDSNAQAFTPASTLTLAVIVALIAGAGFVLKIAGRFVTNALTLAEDAQVRAALADTYIGLTAEEAKATDEARSQARTVMLAALFRPLPGHQQEDITAPTVLSLAQDLIKQNK